MGLTSIGIFTGFAAWGQTSDDFDQRIEEQLSSIEAKYYYTNLDSALSKYQEVANQAAQRQRWDLQLSTLIQMAWCGDYHGDLDTVRFFLNQARLLEARQTDALDTLDAQQSVRLMIPYTEGIYFYGLEDYPRAIESFSQVVLPTSPALRYDSMLVFSVYSYLGQAHYENANYHRASSYHQRAIQWLPRSTFQSDLRDYHYYQTLNYMYLGQCHLAEAQYQNHDDAYVLAKRNFLTALRTLREHLYEASYQNSLSSAYQQLAEWHRLQQHYDSALWYLNRTLPFDESGQLHLLYQIGRTYKDKADYGTALTFLHRALAEESARPSTEHASVWREIGDVYARQTEWDSALLAYQQSLSQLVTDFESTSTLDSAAVYATSGQHVLPAILTAKANALAAKSRQYPSDTLSLQAALATYRQAILAIDRTRQLFPSLEYKQFLSAQAQALYEQAIGASVRAHTLGLNAQNYLAEAFYFAEKSKAATLLEAVKDAEARSFSHIPTELLERENEMKQKLTYWENELHQASDDSVRQALRNRAFDARESYNRLIQQLEREYPHYYQLKYDTEVVSLAQLQEQLPSGTTVLAFSYGDSTLYTFAVRSDEVQWRATPLDSSFHRSLANVLRSVSQYDYQQASDLSVFRAFTNDAYGLYQTLLAPWLSEENKTKQLIIIPDGLLGYLPFDVLLTEAVAPSRVDYQSLPYLVKQLPVSYEYSATLLTASGPPPDEVPYAYLGFAPSYPEVPLAESREVRTTLDGKRLGLGQLRHNREEIAFASQLFQGKTLINEAATEAQFKQYAPQSRVLHLSMHAYANNENDNFSGLIFTQPLDTVQEDGFLHANELYNLSLNSELAVLSACETGIGTLAPGEGIMSLGRAFKYAGCPNVTMSLWNADDQSTSQIMQHFFGHLHNGSAKDRALRRAKLDYLNEARSAQAHPYYWAAFVQVGNGDPLSSAGGFSIGGWIVIGGVVLLILMALIIRYKSAR